ncbi:UPF0716 protein FxsA [Propionibacteriaceae bacterium ES.041]|uniref:FxsA family protein n=1 Tax=Enemella evansiae TaxID=2016499 RepID=UPI000B96943F|nr:FxsA family protein [Enemella evansiae]OYO20544.1 hypothetical protein BI335_03175 [Enemella evansiae]PFG67220.1 UPF0716 protein FxsA [Propionibacteriaceae bacterium ES.041]TDO93079.1 UPF0716 protein FxsA [Enemella evansiae]
MAAAPRRRPWLVPLLAVLFLVVTMTELWVILQLGGLLGLIPTLLLMVLSSVAGAWLTKREGVRAWRALNKALASGQMPQGELADAALVLSGGLMLFFPGFITDAVGLIFLIPFTRPAARWLLGKVVGAKLRNYQPPNPLSGMGAAGPFLRSGPGAYPEDDDARPRNGSWQDPSGGRASGYGDEGVVIEGEVIDDDPDPDHRRR